jgi:hypothetical protein
MNDTTNFKIEEGGVYRNEVGNIIEIRNINKEKNMVLLYNISESCNQYVTMRNSRFVSRIR